MPMPIPTRPLRELLPVPPLPKIYSEDKRVNKPEEYFQFAARYRYVRLLGHGAYGMVWYTRYERWWVFILVLVQQWMVKMSIWLL